MCVCVCVTVCVCVCTRQCIIQCQCRRVRAYVDAHRASRVTLGVLRVYVSLTAGGHCVYEYHQSQQYGRSSGMWRLRECIRAQDILSTDVRCVLTCNGCWCESILDFLTSAALVRAKRCCLPCVVMH